MKHRVLVIDDAPVIRELLKDVLTDFGFQVDLAGNGLIGTQQVEKNDYDLIFCDVHMPVLNGQETVIRIKEIKPNIPIIMTDSFPDLDAQEAQDAGAICCLNKPFDLDELRQMLKHFLNVNEIKVL